MWWVKSRRAQSDTDYETWIQGGVVPTLNVFDNTTDTRATVLILFEANRRDGIRLHGDISPTLQAYIGTGGNNMPMIAWSIREDAKANTFSATELQTTNALQAHQPSVQSHHAQTFITGEQLVTETIVRRLTPTECERLQGFPDDWTTQRIDHKTGQVVEQKDSARYKQMGNAVAVPCVQWLLARIIERMDNV